MIPRPPAARAAWILAAAVGLFVTVAAQFPHVQAWHANRAHYFPDKVYTGALTTSAEDTMTYWGWMEQARQGHFFFEDLYTPEANPKEYANPFFWALGVAARVARVSIPFTYAAARPVVGAIVLILFWTLAGIVFPRPWERLACYLMGVLPGGFEGLFSFLERNHGWGHVPSPGWWIPEMNTFFSLMLFPHFLFGFALMLVTALLLLRGWDEPVRWPRYAVGAGIALSVLTFCHPYDAVTMLGVAWSAPAAFAFAERRLPRREIAVTLGATAVWTPSLLYNWIVFRSNPAMRAWDLQNVMVTPEWGRLAFALGVAGVLAMVALVGLRRMSRPQLVMAGWFVSTLILVHLPLRFQRRMLGGIQFPVAVLAVFTLSTWVVPPFVRLLRRGAAPSPAGRATLVAVLALGPVQWLTPYYLLDIEKTAVRRVRFPAWIARSESDALRYVRNTAPASARVLSSYEMGNYVPALAGKHCVLGHYGLTIDAERKRLEIRSFYSASAADDAWRRALIARYAVSHVLHTAHERALGDWDPATVPWLREVYRAGEGDDRAIVYEVIPAAR